MSQMMNSTQRLGNRANRLGWLLLGAAMLTLSPWMATAENIEIELPPPPVDGQASSQYALLQIPAMDMQAGSETPELQLAELSASVAADGAGAVQDTLQALGQEAPKQSMLETMLVEQLQQAMPSGSQGYIFDKVMLPGKLKIPESGWSVKYFFRLPQRGIGSTPFSAVVADEQGTQLQRFSGSVTIDREARGVQVTRSVRKGEVLGDADVVELGTRLSVLPRGAYSVQQSAIGSAARSDIQPGQWLTEQMVQPQQVIQRGQMVTIKLERGPIQINAPGVATQAGARGAVIRVANAQTKRELFARVISKDEVQVVN